MADAPLLLNEGGGGLRSRGQLETERASTSSRGGWMNQRHDSYREDHDEEFAGLTGHAWRDDHPNAAHHKLSEAEKELMCSYESLDYDPIRSVGFMERNLKRSDSERNRQSAFEWITFGAIGATVGTIAFLVDKGVEWLSDVRFDTVKDVDKSDLPGLYFGFVSVSMIYGLIAAMLIVYVEPVAAGSGIPQIKGYLNGTNYQRFLVFKTGLVKVVGILFSVSSGLCIGKEGPLIHTGAVVAANLSALPNFAKRFPGQSWVYRFRSDRAKRDFVSGGAAAGVAAAFGAPVGGILFSLEEASSFWSVLLTWKVFFCSMTSTFTLYGWLALADNADSFQGLVSYGSTGGDDYHLWEVIPYMGLGLIGGFLGALFCHINERLCHWRRDVLNKRKAARVAEVVAIVWLTSTMAFWLPAMLDSCSASPAVADAALDDEYYQSYTCADGEYSSMATLIFTTNEKAIKGFFHDTARISSASLLAYCLNAFVMAVITYGIAVPSGLFVPCILVGSAFGRLVGEHMRDWFGDNVNPGTYALLGATSMLSGVSRITITLTVIMLETTNDIEFLLPIMIVTILAKFVADQFNISLYDLHVELMCIPFVESMPPPEMENMACELIMSQPAVVVPERATARELLRVLQDTTHNGFPVVTVDSGRYVGLVLRNQIVVMLRSLGGGPIPLESFAPSLSSKRLPHEGITLSPEDGDMTLDLAPYMNLSPISIQKQCPMARVYMLFRSMGLRHLVVVDEHQVPCGCLSRKDIMTSFTQDLY